VAPPEARLELRQQAIRLQIRNKLIIKNSLNLFGKTVKILIGRKSDKTDSELILGRASTTVIRTMLSDGKVKKTSDLH
jgi:hypothetical protein